MGLFDKLRGKEAEKQETTVPKIDWISLTEPGQLTAIAKQTAKTSVLFKHSTRCGISNAVLKQFESKNEALNGAFDFYFLDLLNYRSISNEIAEKFGVEHQSPQLLVVKNGTVVASASHYDLVEIDLEKEL